MGKVSILVSILICAKRVFYTLSKKDSVIYILIWKSVIYTKSRYNYCIRINITRMQKSWKVNVSLSAAGTVLLPVFKA